MFDANDFTVAVVTEEAWKAMFAEYEKAYPELAAKYNLAVSGGSDFHGANKPKIDLGTGMGKLFLPEDLLGPIKEMSLFYSETAQF